MSYWPHQYEVDDIYVEINNACIEGATAEEWRAFEKRLTEAVVKRYRRYVGLPVEVDNAER